MHLFFFVLLPFIVDVFCVFQKLEFMASIDLTTPDTLKGKYSIFMDVKK